MSADIIAHYEAIAAAAADMLAAARAADWDRLTAAERECARRVARLSALGPADLDACQRRRRNDLIRTVLAYDAEIRDLTQPWLARLERLLAATATARRVERAYR